MIFKLIILFILVSKTSNISVFSFPGNDTDQQALLSFKASITADPLGALDSWNNSIHFCQWIGVTCSTRRQRVTALNLNSQNLVGKLSPHIGNLSFLKGIYLYQNNFHGSIPNEFGLLFRLQHLDLGSNSFQGGFPPNLSNCVDIRNISMDKNNLEGKLPTVFVSWPELYWLNLGDNRLTGLIPPSIGNISSLSFLHLRANNLEGLIPLELAHHRNLEVLGLSLNNLSGMVPLPLYNISSLYILSLTQNELEGTLPGNLGITLPKLQEFKVAANRFSGPIPPSITNASDLVVLEITVNSITGPIPNNFGSLPNLEWLNLGHNPLGDNMHPDELSFFNSLANCSRLNHLGLGRSGLRGQLPDSIVNLSTTIQLLFLYSNHLYGSIPRDIGKLENLTVLSFSNNLLTGTIPESIGELSKLGRIHLNGNNISGTIPTSISNITRLFNLSLENNILEGSLPIGLFNVSTLQGLYLNDNSLNGVIPEQIGEFSSQCTFLYLERNLFTGPLPWNIGSLKQLVHLSVSNNKLTGDIPATLGSCVMMEELYMDRNLFQGRIPSFKALKSLKFLDLSSNNLSENIPGIFDGFPLIEFVNLSHNKLEGEVPRKGLFLNMSAFSVVGNLQLCGGIQALHLPACPVKVSRNAKKIFSLRTILLIVLVPLGIFLAVLALICYLRQNSKKLNNPVPVLQDNQYLNVSYKDLLLATNEFSPNNLLGEGRYGSVYKGVLRLPKQSVEHIVAVKVLKVDVRGANKSFLAEYETLRTIRHRNLIKIITACFSTDFKGNDFKALVFEFMTNGSVDDWLHPSHCYQGNERNLSLLQRLNISIDIAQGVDYLHHYTHAGIIHCDIKPSNILLDENFVARIGDFGLARFWFSATTSHNNQEHLSSSSTGVRGTVGYVPPEYGMCAEISAEGDVYSYGILLLELFTGKRPTESSIMMDSGNNLHDYVRKALPERVMDIADPRIFLFQEKHGLTVNQSYSRATMEVCLASIFEVGILCSVEMPRKRIGISVAVRQLQMARATLLQRMQ